MTKVRKWDEGEHEGCGIDSQRAFEKERSAQSSPDIEQFIRCPMCGAKEVLTDDGPGNNYGCDECDYVASPERFGASLQPATPTAGEPVAHLAEYDGHQSVTVNPALDKAAERAAKMPDWMTRKATGGDAVAGDVQAARTIEPVGWQYRYKRWAGEWSEWSTLSDGWDGWRNPDNEYRPLFTGVAQGSWKPFHPNDWHLSTFCYPCVLIAPDGEVGAPCDPWTLPPDNDWEGWVCCALPVDYADRIASSIPSTDSECGFCGGPLPCLTHSQGLSVTRPQRETATPDAPGAVAPARRSPE